MPNNDKVGEEESSKRNDTKHEEKEEEEEEEEEKGGTKLWFSKTSCELQENASNCHA